MNGGSEEGEESSENLEAAFLAWDAPLKEEFEELKKMLILCSKNGEEDVTEKNIKRKLAYFCLKVIDNTSHHKKDIKDNSYFLAEFIKFSFGDSLDHAFILAGELELDEAHTFGNTFENWKKLRNIFEDYLKNN